MKYIKQLIRWLNKPIIRIDLSLNEDYLYLILLSYIILSYLLTLYLR